jgi:hypothetical protein
MTKQPPRRRVRLELTLLTAEPVERLLKAHTIYGARCDWVASNNYLNTCQSKIVHVAVVEPRKAKPRKKL